MEKQSHSKHTKEPNLPKMRKAKIKKAFGKAKLFEIRRLVRRIKQISLKKGSEQQLLKNKRKVGRLEEQLETLKDMRFEEIMEVMDKDEESKYDSKEKGEGNDSKTIVLSKLLKIVREEERKHVKLNQGKKSNVASKMSNRNPTSSHSKLNTLENILNDSDISDSENLKIIDESFDEPKVIDNDDNGNRSNDERKGKTIETRKLDISNDSCDISDSEDIANIDSDSMERKEDISNDYCDISDSENSTLIKSDSMPVSYAANVKRKRDGREMGKRKMAQEQVSIPQDDLDISSCDEDFVKKRLSLDSVFVGSLSNEKGKRNGNKKRDGRKKKGKEMNNRLGQRQRRQQWAKMYGKKANHLNNENRKDGTNEKKGKRDKTMRNETAGRKKKMLKSSVVLHPSWEASKSKRKQESIVAFEGKKITFDD